MMLNPKEVAVLLQRNKNLRDENIRLKKRLEIAKFERDAAVSDLNRARHCLTCEVNRESKDETDPDFHLLCRPCHYAWRGPCKENGGAEDGKVH